MLPAAGSHDFIDDDVSDVDDRPGTLMGLGLGLVQDGFSEGFCDELLARYQDKCKDQPQAVDDIDDAGIFDQLALSPSIHDVSLWWVPVKVSIIFKSILSY
jgi:hypothetical protein